MKTRTVVIWVVVIGAVTLFVLYALLPQLGMSPPSKSDKTPPSMTKPAQPTVPDKAPPQKTKPKPPTMPDKVAPPIYKPTLPEKAKPAPPADPFATIDRILAELEVGNIAFNTPRSINVNDTAMIQLLLGLGGTVEELKQRIEAAGEKEGAQVRVSNRMEARLSGPNFAITAITPEVQAITRSAATEWKWEVKPKSVGQHHLHLTLSVLLNVDGTTARRAIRTFDKEIEIEVTLGQQVGSFFKNNWQWLWAAILVPVVGWLWRSKKKAS